MAFSHLQLPGGTSLYVDDGNEELWMTPGKTFTLEHVGFGAAAKGAPTIKASTDAVTVAILNTSDNKQTFSVTARHPGKSTLIAHQGGNLISTQLDVFVGTMPKHFGSDSIDLLSDVLNGSDPMKIHLVQQMLYNKEDNVFNQKTAKNKHPVHGGMACGIVVKERGNQIFSKQPLSAVPQLGSKTDVPETVCPIHYENPYHEPLSERVQKRSDLKYKADVIRDVRLRMFGLLKAGTPVRVGVADRPDVMGLRKPIDPKRKGYDLYAYDAGGHTVLIFGCNFGANEFLYMDPWGGGSRLKYGGGLTSITRPDMCYYMGIFKSVYDPDRLLAGEKPGNENLLRMLPDSEWSFSTAGGNYLEIISGP